MDKLTSVELQTIKERAEKATAGPWIISPEFCGPEGQGVYETGSFGCICEVGDPYPRGNNRPQENMEFIAHAREDVPKLLAEVERLQSELDREKGLKVWYRDKAVKLAEKVDKLGGDSE